MPARAPFSRTSTNGSRTGCVTCKRRRKKCDRTQPTCTNCEKRGVLCEGYQQLFVLQDGQGRRAKKRTASVISKTFSADCPSQGTSSGSPDAGSAAPDDAGSSTAASALFWVHLVPHQPSLDRNLCEAENEHYQLMAQPGSAESPLSPTEEPLPSSTSNTVQAAPETEAMRACISDDGTSQVDEQADAACPQQDLYFTDGGFSVEFAADAAESVDEDYNEKLIDEFADETIEGFATNITTDVITAADPAFISGPRHHIGLFPDFTEEDFYYLQYLHEQAAAELLNMDSGVFNPLRRLILPQATACAGVLNATCAVAACHKAQRSNPDTRLGLSVIAARFYLKSVEWLRSTFGTVGVPDDASVLTALLLCKYEIVRGSATHWRDHLDGLELLLQKRGGIGCLETECGQYVASFLRYHRMMADICHCEISMPSRVESDLDMIASSSLSIDVYSGCSNHLLRACHNITRVAGRIESQDRMGYSDFARQCDEIIVSLGTSIIEPSVQVCSGIVGVSQISRLLYVAQRIHYSAFVFLHAIVDCAVKTCGFSDAEHLALRRRVPYTKAQAPGGCLEMLADIPVGGHCEFAGLALALFLAGCEVQEESRKFLILEKLFAIERSFGLGHISRGRDALMMIWQRGRGTGQKVWWNAMREMGWEMILC